MKKKSLFFGFLFVLMLALVACGGSDETSSDGDSDDSASGDAIQVPIGYTGPLSGPAAFYGENTTSGLQMAIDEINEAGGFEIDGQQYEFKYVPLDDQYLPDEAANNAKRLVQEENAKIIFNPHSGGIYAMQVFNEQDGFLIGAYTSEPGIIETDNSLTWRIPPGYDGYLEPFTKYQMDRFGPKVAFLPTASQYGKDWADFLRPVWEENGGEIVYETQIDFNKDTDVQPIVTNALQHDPDVLFIGGPSEPTALVVKAARELGFEGGFIIMDQAKLDEMAAVLDGNWDLLEGSAGALPLVHSDYPGTPAFVEKYNELYGKDPGSEAGFHYLAVYALVEAMKIAGSVDDVEAIRDALDEAVQSVPEEKQVYVIDGVDENGANKFTVRMGVVEDGEVVELTADDVN